jgi:hypothetical protein
MTTMSAMALPELEGLSHEYELEAAAPVWRGAYVQGEAQTEAFFEDLAEYAVGGGGRGTGLGGVGRAAARAALQSTAGGVPLAAIGISNGGSAYVDRESGIVRVPPLVVMEHFGHAMAQAETETEAEAFLPFLLPLAARALPMVARAVLPRLAPLVRRIAPRLVRGASGVLRTLRQDPATKPLVRVLPNIMRRTLADVVRDVQRGTAVTPQRAVRQLAGETRRVLSNPSLCVGAYRRSRALDRRYHLLSQQGLWR